MKKHLLVVLLFLPVLLCKAQEKVVEFNLDTKEFTGTLPFDERFKIKFTSTTDIAHFTIKYKIKDYNPKNRKRKYYYQDAADSTGYIKIDRQVNAKTFSIGNIGPIHANAPYEFQFIAFKKIVLTEEEDKELKDTIRGYLNSVYISGKPVPDANIVIEKFNSIAQKYVDGELYNRNQKKIKELDLLKSLREQIIELRRINNNKNTKIKSYINLSKNQKEIITEVLTQISNIDTTKTDQAQLKKEVDTSGDLKKATLKQFIGLVKGDAENEFKTIMAIISGDSLLKLDNNMLVTEKTNEKYNNTTSLYFLGTAFKKLSVLKKADTSSNIFNPNTDFTEVTDIFIGEEGFVDLSEDINTLTNVKLKPIPNILADMYTEVVLSEVDQFTFTDVQTKASPYINMDAGGLFATQINDTFVLETINFHFLPVNRDALFADIKGFWNYIGKAASLQIGLAQRVGPTDSRYENYLTGTLGTPYIGVGFRLSRIIRVSAGTIFYQQANTNPVIDDKVVKGSFAFTITINSALSKAIGGIEKFFTTTTTTNP